MIAWCVALVLWAILCPLCVLLGYVLYNHSKSIKPNRFVKIGNDIGYYTVENGKGVIVTKEGIKEFKDI